MGKGTLTWQKRPKFSGKKKSAQAGNNMVATFKHTTLFLKGNCDTFVTHNGAKLIMSVPNPPSRCQKKKKVHCARLPKCYFFLSPMKAIFIKAVRFDECLNVFCRTALLLLSSGGCSWTSGLRYKGNEYFIDTEHVATS